MHTVAVQHRKSTPWGLLQFLPPVLLDTQLPLSSRSPFQPPCSHILPHYTTLQMVLPSCDHYSTHVHTLLASGDPLSGTIVTVADCTSRPSRSRDLSLGRCTHCHFTKEVTSLARPVHTLPAQHHSATTTCLQSRQTSLFLEGNNLTFACTAFIQVKKGCQLNYARPCRKRLVCRAKAKSNKLWAFERVRFAPDVWELVRYPKSTNCARGIRPWKLENYLSNGAIWRSTSVGKIALGLEFLFKTAFFLGGGGLQFRKEILTDRSYIWKSHIIVIWHWVNRYNIVAK